MPKLTALLACGILCGFAPAAPGADPDPVALLDVTVIDVEDDSRRRGQDVVLGAQGIEAIGPHGSIPIPRHAVRHDARRLFLIPSLWDLHVHAHRDRRWTYQHPLLLAHGVTLVRDAGSHLGSALAARERVAADPLAPDVIWGSPPIEGAPPINSFGLAAEDGPSARRLVRELDTLGFDFVKVYDGLTREAYFALAEEARRLGMPVEGHVPLRVSPDEAVAAGQRLVDHLTLMVERCIPGVLDWVGAAGTSDSMTLLSDGRLAAALPRFDPALCAEQMQLHRRAGVWHVPTLVQMRGFFHADDPAVTEDLRARWVPAAVRDAWREHARRAPPESLAAGRAVLDRQMKLVGAMHRAGVRLLAGTDTSAEPWVFAGSSLHDELGLLVDAGLSPVAALRAATVDARVYAGRGAPRLIAPGQPADLVLLDGDPTAAIANTRRIHAVIRRGQFLGRPELDALLERARAAAER